MEGSNKDTSNVPPDRKSFPVSVQFLRSFSKREAAWVRRLQTQEQLRAFILSSLALTFVFGIWILVPSASHLSTFPSLSDVISAARQITVKGYAGATLATHIVHSIKLAGLGFLSAVVVAIPLGIASALSTRFNALINPVVAFIRPIPPLAWVPIAIIWFGLGDAAKVFVIWFTAFVPALINTQAGVTSVDPVLLAAARVHGAGRVQLLIDVIIPGALPMIFTGLRVALQGAWMTVVAAELVGAFYGLGRVLSIAAQDIYPGMIVVAMACVALSGALMNRLLIFCERLALPWRAAL